MFPCRVHVGVSLWKRISCKQILRRFSLNKINNLKSEMNEPASSKTKTTVGVIQMTSTADKESNFQQVSSLVEEAQNQGAKMVFLPECCDYIGETTEQTISMSETTKGELMGRYRDLARKLDVWISIGGFHKRVAETEKTSKIHNTNIVLNSSGNIVSEYNKVHLFDIAPIGPSQNPLTESRYTIPGFQIVSPVSTPAGRLGQCICYDLRFPAISTRLRQMGAELIAYPSAFTVPTGSAHWEVLLRSRAIETQCYVLAPAQVGQHNKKRTSYGHTMIVDPWGEVVAECKKDQPGLCLAEIDLDLVSKVRRDMPVFEHHRSDLYDSWVPREDDKARGEWCDFGEHKIKHSTVFYSTRSSFAFVNNSPVLPGHVLVASRRKVARLKDLSGQELTEVFRTVQVVSKVIEEVFGATSTTISVQDGEGAGQTVKHVHVHILPRKFGDFESNDKIYEKLERHDKEEGRSRRSEHSMEVEAKMLRDAVGRSCS